MKLKVKLDPKAIQEFLLQNVEKIVLGIVGLIFLSMAYSAIAKSGRYRSTPEQLQTEATAGQRTIDATSPDSPEYRLVVADYVAQAKLSRVHIKENPYSLVGWDNPLFERQPLRDAPALFAVQDLQGAAGMAACRTTGATAAQPAPGGGGGTPRRPKAAAGGEQTCGQRWIVLTGLVPVEKQQAAYDETFKNSVFHDPQKDYPIYLGYLVRRVEVTSSADAANLNWDAVKPIVSIKAIGEAEKQLVLATEADVVEPRYIERNLVFPLVTVMNRPWDASVAHGPEIPLKGKEHAEGPGTSAEQPDTKPSSGEKPGENNPFGGEEPKPASVVKTVAAEKNVAAEETKDLGYKLFRFFDFGVEPGKQYVYRVQLWLRNPNQNVKATFLKTPELANGMSAPTKWSDPSPVISVPRDTRVLANSVEAKLNSEPIGQVTVVKWLDEMGIEVPKEFSVTRGKVLNFSEVKVAHVDAPVDFLSNTTAVDLRGGEHLGRKGSSLTAVGQILLMDTDGSLIVHNELDDGPLCEQLKKEEKAAAPPIAPHALHKAGGAATPPPGGGLQKIFQPKKRAGH